MKVVITGVTGFIGTHLCKYMLEKGAVVYGIGRRFEYLSEALKNKNFIPVRCDFNYGMMPDEIIDERGFDYFFHLAHFGVNGPNKTDYRIQLKNAITTCDLVESAIKLGCKKFVFAGSADEFEIDELPDRHYRTPSHSMVYALSKLSAESIGKQIAKRSGIGFSTALFSLTYGEGNRTNVLPNMLIRCVANRKPVKLIKGDSFFDMVYIKDTVEALVHIAEKGKPYESYFVGHRELKTFKNHVYEVLEVLRADIELQFGAYDEPGYQINYAAIDRDKLFEDTGFECSTPLDVGIKRTSEWLLSGEI